MVCRLLSLSTTTGLLISQLNPSKHISITIELQQFSYFHARKHILKCRLQTGGYFHRSF